MENKAAWLTGHKVKPFKVDDAPFPTPIEHEVVIRNHAIATNMVDGAIYEMGIIYDKFPNIIGCDIAGEVVEVGSNVTQFKKGDRVVACCESGETQKPEHGAFQLYSIANWKLVAKLPDNISYKDGCVLPLALCTAAVGLFQKDCLNLPHPQVNPTPNGQVLVIWGVGSSVGTCGLQMAKAAGLDVIAVASAHNSEYCKSIGADQAFDYKSPTVIEDIVKALKGRNCAGVFASMTDADALKQCCQIASQIEDGRKFVATVLPDFWPLPEGLPSNVKTSPNWGLALKNNEVGEAVWGKWLTPALANGTMKCKPDPFIVGQGLEKISEACEMHFKGISAKKLVVELP